MYSLKRLQIHKSLPPVTLQVNNLLVFLPCMSAYTVHCTALIIFLPLAVDFIIAIIRFSDYLPADMSLPSAGELVNTSGGHVCIYRLYYIATV